MDFSPKGEGLRALPKGFSNHPFKTISIMGFTKFFGDGNPKFGANRLFLVGVLNRNKLSREATTFFCDSLKLLSF